MASRLVRPLLPAVRECISSLPGRLAVRGGKGEPERRSGSGYRVDSDPSPAGVDDALADGQPDPGALVPATGMQALEHLEDALGVGHVDTDAVVNDRQPALPVNLFGADVDAWWILGPVLDGVAD